MTFLDTIKNEMVASPPKKPCCRRCMLLGMLSARGNVVGDATVTLRLSHRGSEELALHLIKEQFGRQAQVLPASRGGRYCSISFESPSAKRFLDELGEFFSHPLQKHCPGCAPSYLKGVFLVAGHIADPQKSYHLELSLGERAEAFSDFFAMEYGYTPKLVIRKSERLLYFKDSTAIEELMTLLGINDAAFLLMNCKIEKQFRNEANRRTNCEAGNITRTVNAAAKVLLVLREMKEKGTLSALPEELSDVAMLRLANPEASLTQLAAMTTPPITKSGVNHRLQKIMELAEKQKKAVKEEK